MKRLTPLALVFFFAVLACARPPAARQDARAGRAAKGLAVEIDDERYRDFQLSIKSSVELGNWPRVPGREEPAGAARLAGVKLDADEEGDAVRVNVSVVFDDSWPPDAPGPKYGRKVQPAASFLAREGEAVRVEELARFGVAPLTLRVVKARRRPGHPPLASTPLVDNKLRAVVVVGFGPEPSEPAVMNAYNVRLQNVSQKKITALALYEAQGGGRNNVLLRGTAARPLAAPGEVYEARFNFGGGRTPTPHGDAGDAERQRTLTVGTVVFDDDTYEGEDAAAASLLAARAGEEAQRERIMPLLRALLDAPPPDAAAALERLKTEVSALRIDADPAVVAQLLARFPSLRGGEGEKHLERDAIRSISTYVMSGLRNARTHALHTIKYWEVERARSPETFDLGRRLSALVEQMEKGGPR